MNPLIRLCGLKRHRGLCDLTGRAEGTDSDMYAPSVKGVLTCMRNTGTIASITLAFALTERLCLRQNRETASM